MSRTTRQNAEVLARLQHGSLTPKDAIQFGCYRLAARVFELREAGYNISTVREHDGDKIFARYVLLGRYRELT